jgi:hypothetical protein
MNYDAGTVAMLRAVLDELLVSEAFTRQDHFSAVDLAQCILNLASQGERDAQSIRQYILHAHLGDVAA